MRKQITIGIPTYKTLFKLKVFSKEKDIRKENDVIMKRFGDNVETDYNFNGRSYDIYIDDEGYRSADVVIKYKHLTHGVLAHEIYHSVNYILDYCGIIYDESSEEAYSHLIHYITDCIYIKAKEQKIKIKTA